MEVKIVRSKRKTLSLTVTRGGEVVVRAPLGASRAAIDGFVKRHLVWVEKRLRAVKEAPALRLEDGAVVWLFGEKYLIGSGTPRLGEGRIFLPAEGREGALTRLLKKLSGEKMEALTARIAAEHGFSYRKTRVSSARSRWGSCNREGTISYTFRVAFLPPELCEYVAVHELAHTVAFDHSAAFWQVVERVLPDYKARRKALRAHPAIGFL